MNDNASLARLLENLIRLGTIAQVQMAPPRVRVKTGELLSGWLPWLATRAGAAIEWDPPTLDEQVLVLSPSGHLASGIVLTGLYSESIPANGDRSDLHRRTYSDGAIVEYDSTTHQLRAQLPEGGTTELISNGGIHLVGPITHEGDYTQTGNFIQSGDQSVTGKVTTTVDVVAAGKSLVEHLHLGNLGTPTSPPL